MRCVPTVVVTSASRCPPERISCFCNCTRLISRIELGKPILMPEDTISPGGIHKWNGDLRIHLGEFAGYVPEVIMSILERTKPKQVFIFRGIETFCSATKQG